MVGNILVVIVMLLALNIKSTRRDLCSHLVEALIVEDDEDQYKLKNYSRDGKDENIGKKS